MRIPTLLNCLATSAMDLPEKSTRLVSISDGRNRDTKTKNQSIENTGTNPDGFSANPGRRRPCFILHVLVEAPLAM